MLSNILFGCEISHHHEVPRRAIKTPNPKKKKKKKKKKSLNFQN
jgi:hypothetical protein